MGPIRKTTIFVKISCPQEGGACLIRILQEVQPDEIYNLGAQSHMMVSFETPEYTANADAPGTLRLLEAIRILGNGEKF